MASSFDCGSLAVYWWNTSSPEWVGLDRTAVSTSDQLPSSSELKINKFILIIMLH